MIPKRIITIWLNDQPAPELVERCIKSQDIEGYQHTVVRLADAERCLSPYVKTCIERKDWVRAVDYLRLWYLNEYGGVYLDADTEVFPSKNLDEFLMNRMFVFKENSGYLNNGFIGSEHGHPFLKYVLTTMENNFRFDQNLFFPGMQFFCESYFMAARSDLGMAIYDDKEFKDIFIHHGLKSWLKD